MSPRVNAIAPARAAANVEVATFHRLLLFSRGQAATDGIHQLFYGLGDLQSGAPYVLILRQNVEASKKPATMTLRGEGVVGH